MVDSFSFSLFFAQLFISARNKSVALSGCECRMKAMRLAMYEEVEMFIFRSVVKVSITARSVAAFL